MNNLVFVTGDYCSGSTLLFTLFRKAGEYYCLYEPLHGRLLEYLIWPLRVYEHHFFVDNYFSEYKGFREIPRLFSPEWAVRDVYLAPDAEAPDLYRYLSYLAGSAFGRSEKVLLKENQLTLRSGWVRAHFPQARIVHIYRDKEKQWNSMVRRVQAYLGREDVGQEDVMFQGFNVATWCEDLKGTFPELDARHSRCGYDRFCKLWERSLAEGQRYADVSVDYGALTHDFANTCETIWRAIGCSADFTSLKEFVIPPKQQKELGAGRAGMGRRAQDLIDRAGRRYARARLMAAAYLRQRLRSPKAAR